MNGVGGQVIAGRGMDSSETMGACENFIVAESAWSRRRCSPVSASQLVAVKAESRQSSHRQRSSAP